MLIWHRSFFKAVWMHKSVFFPDWNRIIVMIPCMIMWQWQKWCWHYLTFFLLLDLIQLKQLPAILQRQILPLIHRMKWMSGCTNIRGFVVVKPDNVSKNIPMCIWLCRRETFILAECGKIHFCEYEYTCKSTLTKKKQQKNQQQQQQQQI